MESEHFTVEVSTPGRSLLAVTHTWACTLPLPSTINSVALFSHVQMVVSVQPKLEQGPDH